MCLRRVLYLLILVFIVDSAKVRHQTAGKQALKFLKGIGVHNKKMTSANGGLWPSVFNLATKALISSNATCGESGREEFCRMSEGSRGRCGICDNFSPDPGKRHPINYAIDDGTNRWWQSSPVYYGARYEYVTITLDLKQVYQVAYVIIKAANSPRPGAWILERSIDGENYGAWQYFATSDKDCLDRYGIPARKGKPHYFTDSEVICTSFYSKLMPMENGEIHTFLVHGRPGANDTSPELLQFTKARYVRLRLQGLRGSVDPLPAWLSQDIARDKRLYYSIRDISIGGQCVCNGHASSCRHNVASGHPECECAHHTCGSNCDRCCSLFNQRKWGPATSRDSRICLPCNCHGHAKSCHYDEDVDRAGLSLDINGYYQGGGVCDNCTSHTTGINCEKCAPGYYRPIGTDPDAPVPCVKCDCDALGSTGHCVPEGPFLRCECNAGFAGTRCDECAEGYRGYPLCEICPCDSRGVLSDECETDCVCKSNVNGKFCDHCKPGYFSLRADNPEGCSACYCSGVTTLCEAAHLPPKAYETGDGWLISDISVTEIEEPTLDERNMISVGNYEIPGIEAYYWLAPSLYLGNKLETYGSDLVFKVHWVVIRGDTSGKPTTGPNIIIVGQNGMRIASGDDAFSETNMTFKIKLAEYKQAWYHVPYDVKDIITRLRRTEYKGDIVTRTQFLSVLANIKHILLRAKFHTDQIEGSLEGVVMYTGNFREGYSAVEKCSCPSGYTGLSCESCQYGYVRIISNTTSHEQLGFCVKCDCNGHSGTCNADTGECFCEHNTIGETCERCAPGYYGNPLLGMPNDCKKCACPLEIDENNFSPSCQLDSSSLSNDDDEPGYVCTQCPKGYTGDHCEICDDGYFGVPSQVGGKCEPCSCGGGPCDRITGQCLGCRGNTEGWRCERCKAGYYGDPVIGCEACLCDPQGSIKPDCNNVTGECECKEHFIGRTCNKCEVGFGNVTAHCTPCVCNPVGSKSNICDPHSGLCDCRPGVEGFRCDACQHLHYGFSETGCQSCKCNIKGSEIFTCDIITGQCRCKPHYIGRSCDKCEDEYWNSPSGCQKCDCNLDGSKSKNCDQDVGNCFCRPGVQGQKCDSCKPGHYGFSSTGCKECDVCNKVGHICDPDTGRCVCPRNSYGEKCHLCKINTWGHEPNKGCRSCNCSDTGSLRSQCNAQTGLCFCLQGYTGEKCDRCEHGYYGYPKCRRCSCNYAGSDKDLGNCDTNGICQCNTEGLCPCKANVSGKRCNHCKDGTFGLHMENYNGCTQCFCFGRSTYCKEAGYTWGKIRGENRSLTVDFMDSYKKNRKITSNDVLTLNNFEIIEDNPVDITRSHDHFDIPLFWKLPEKFTGDRLLSYGGYLRFSTDTYAARKPKNVIFKQFPLVKIEGNGVKLYYELPTSKINKNFEIKIHEHFWKSEHAINNAVSRDLIMLTLQNISGIYIKATDYSSFEKIILRDVSWDTAIDVPGSPPPITVGVEKCDCPAEYSGTSCQNPNKGFSRYKTQHPHIVGTTFNSEMIDAIIGKSIACQCNNRSSICDIETGECLNCTENTSGKSCEHCAEGFYGDPMLAKGKCEACACPSPTQNFAISCTTNPRSNYFNCKCKKGYIGASCDRCSPGYYGQPQLPGGNCKPCNCNKDGRITNECDQITGHCSCKAGITGPKCSQCEKLRHVLENKQCIPCDNCTTILLDKLDNMMDELMQNTSHLQGGVLQPPWETLENFRVRYLKLESDYDDYLDRRDKLTALIDARQVEIFGKEAESLSNLYKEREHNLEMINTKAKENSEKIQELSISANKTKEELMRLIKTLNDFGKSHISTKDAVRKANKLLLEIKTQYDEIKDKPSQLQTLTKCKKIYDDVKKIAETKYTNPLKIRSDLVNLSSRLFDLEKVLNSIKQNNTKLQEKNFNNEEKYVKIKEDLENATKQVNSINKFYMEKRISLDDSFKLLETVKNNYDSFVTIRNELDQLTKRMEEKELMLDEGIELLENYRTQLDDHTQNLEKNVSDYKNAFQVSIGAKELNAVNASGRFNEVITGLQEVNNSLIETKKDFNRLLITTIKPEGRDSIYDNTSIAIADSERLVTRAKNLKNQLPGFNERFNKLYGFMETLKSKNWENGLKNNNKNEKIRELKYKIKSTNNIFTSLENTLKAAVAQSDNMRKIYKDASNINISMQYVIVKNFQKYLNLTSSTNIKNLQEKIKVTKELLQNITSYGGQTNIDIIKKVNKALDKFKDSKNSIDFKIQNLSALIKKAKQISSVIRVPLNGRSCSRSYRLPHLEPSTITKITVHFTSNGLDGGLFHISNGEQYMFLRVDNKKIGFKWKFLNEDYHLWTKDTIEEEQELNVVIERINNVMKINVNTQEYSKIMDEKLTLFNISSSNLLRVGTNGNGKVIGLPGCLKDIIFNAHPVGLWQFEETIGTCSGCNRNNTITNAQVKYIFNGEGYIMDTDNRNMDPRAIGIKFKIRTFDENALLFLAHHNDTYMSIQIKNGFVECGIYYKDNKLKPLIVQDSKIANNGLEIPIECTKTYNSTLKKEDIQLEVNNSITKGTHNNINAGDILKIRLAILYYGGVPPDFPLTDLRYKPFLGLMSEIFVREPLSLQNTQFYGVELFTEDYVSYKRILFDANGYVKLKENIQNLTELNFVLRTESEEGLIMQIDQEEITITLKNGKIMVEIMKKPLMEPINKVNDNEYHLIQLKKLKKHFILYVDGEEQVKYDIKYLKEATNKNEIQIGGYENRINNKFRGTIQDITFSDKNRNASYLYINPMTYVSSKGAKIGRSNPNIKRQVELTTKRFDETILSSENDSMKDMQQTDGCDKINYNLEPDAVKFGDAPGSYVQHNLKDSFWRSDFSIEFEFRTFNKDGLLFIAFGGKDHYNMLEIKDGRVILHIKGKRIKKLPFGVNFDDGKWHQIFIKHTAKQKRKLTIILDGELRKAKVPQNKVNGKLFFGDSYKSDSFVPTGNQINPFRGCIRSLKINNSSHGLINNKNTVHHNIGQCFPNIERGSYFRGDSYAIYSNFFRLSNFLEVSFDFRTSEQNGIFLSISNIDNSPALSIELQNGDVVLSVDMGHGVVTNVTNNLSKYTICNNKWHHVLATFSTELTVNVDGVSQSWVLSDMGLLEHIEAPLYVGGLPDSAPGGTLKVRENFKGCIHNLMIGNKNIDWINMDELNNVSLNSCPVML